MLVNFTPAIGIQLLGIQNNWHYSFPIKKYKNKFPNYIVRSWKNEFPHLMLFPIVFLLLTQVFPYSPEGQC